MAYAELAGLHDTSRFPQAQHLPGCVILRFDAPLIFANARAFRDSVHNLCDDLPAGSWVIIAAEPITDVDTTAGDMLQELTTLLERQGKQLMFAELKDPVRNKLTRYGLDTDLSDDRYFPTLDMAVAAYRASTGQHWVPTGGG